MAVLRNSLFELLPALCAYNLWAQSVCHPSHALPFYLQLHNGVWARTSALLKEAQAQDSTEHD